MFATIWYAGAVVMFFGFQGMTLDECNHMKNIIERDIYNAYQDTETATILYNDGFVFEEWEVTCEPLRLNLQSRK